MAPASSPDWLPAGWSVQFGSQNRGRQSVIYIELESGKKFFSKDDVIRYTKKATNHGEERQPTNNKNPSDKSHMQLAENRDEYPEWLPNGWKVELRTRKSGLQAGREYKCYIDPLTECTFYSKPEVFRYLRTVKRKSFKSRSHKMVNRERCIIKKKTVTATQFPSKVEKYNVEDLPPGWIVEIKVRKVANRLKKDPYYTDPVHGYVFRSKKQVIRYLQTGETSKYTIKPKSMCTNDLKLTDDEIPLSSATKNQKLKHPVTRRQHSEAKKSSELSGLDVQETKSSKLHENRPRESVCALAPNTAGFLEKQYTENLVEECVETKGECSPSCSSHPKAEPSCKHVGKRSSPRLAVLSNKREAKRSKLQDKGECVETMGECSPSCSSHPKAEPSSKHVGKRSSPRLAVFSNIREAKRSKLQDKGECVETKGECSPSCLSHSKAEPSSKHVVKRSSPRLAVLYNKREAKMPKLQDKRVDVALAPTTEAVPHKLLSESMAVNCAKSKEDCSSSKLSQPKAELSNKCEENIALVDGSSTEPGKVIFSKDGPASTPTARRSQTEARKLKKKEKLNTSRRSSKRLAGLGPEPVNSLVSTLKALQVATRKPSICDGSLNAGLASDDFVNRASQHLGDAPETEAHHTLSEIISTVQEESLSKVTKPCNGFELLPVDAFVSNEQNATRKSGRSNVSRDGGLASVNLINEASLQLVPASEPETVHETLTDRNSTSHGESLNKGNTHDDEAVPKEQHHKVEPEKVDAEKPGPELCFLFGSDPCLEFAFRTLTGELPIAQAMNNEPILKRTADTVQKENTLENGSCSRKARATSNKSKKAKQLKLPHQTSKRLTGFEPELVAKPLYSERATQIATIKSRRSKALQTIDSALEASQQFEAGQENKVAHAPCTNLNPSLHEESSEKIEKSLKDQAVTEEKTWQLETEKAAVENPVSQFSFPFLDTWSDPCLDFAFKTLTGEIPIDDNLFQGYFQGNVVTSDNQRNSLALPDFGSPNFFQSDISPQFNAPEQSTSGRECPMTTSLPPAGNVSMSNCNGVGFGQQLSTSSSFLSGEDLKFTSGSGVGCGQHLSVNSSSSPTGNVVLPNWNGVGSVVAKKDFHGKLKS